MVIIAHLPTNLQPHVNWYSPHKTCFFNQSHCVFYRNFIIINDKKKGGTGGDLSPSPTKTRAKKGLKRQ